MKNLGRQLAMTGIYTLAVLGSFVIAAIVNVILEAGGLSDDMALGIALIVWVILLAGSVFGILSLYKSTGDRVERVTIIQESTLPQVPRLRTVEGESQVYREEQPNVGSPRSSYLELLVRRNRKEENLGQRSSNQ